MAFGVAHLTHLVEQLQAQVAEALALLNEINERTLDMPTRADFDAAKAQLQQALADATTRINTDLQALRDQIANGAPISDQDVADIQNDVAQLANLDPQAQPAPPQP
jgi:hypothetical protein